MHGGTTRGRLSAGALTVLLLVVGAGCQDQASRDTSRASATGFADMTEGASSEVDPAAYDVWQPTYGEVRPATEEDVASLRQRVADLDATPYTVSVPLFGFDIASTPDHVRVRFGEGGTGGFDLHLDPTSSSDTLFEGFVLCSADEGSCVEVVEDRPDDGGPHLFNNGVDTILFYANSIVGTQQELSDELGRVEDAAVTTVESPAGTLDCLLTGSTAEKRERLAGKSLELMADPFSRVGGTEPLRTVCLDEHGLAVVTLPSLVAGVVGYSSFTTGVPDGFDEHPDPVPNGTTPRSTPTPTQAPTSSDPMEMVLIASDDIDEGESLQDVLAAGKLELTTVGADQLVPGAISSTPARHGVATRLIHEGEQITSTSFD